MQVTSMRHRGIRAVASAIVAGAVISTAVGCAPAAQNEPSTPVPDSLAVSTLRQPSAFNVTSLSEGNDAYIWSSIYDRLLVKDADGNLQPNAATGWEYSSDGLTLTVKLREDMKFSNGDQVTSQDVKATIDNLKSKPGPHTDKVVLITSVDTPDDFTVVINLSQPDPSLLHNLAAVVGVIADADNVGAETAATNPVGSGPYTLDTSATTQGSVYTLKKREDYWNADAYPFKTFTVKVISDSTAAENALRSGELNVAMTGPASKAALEAQNYGITSIDAVAVGVIKIVDRAGAMQPALADPRVRKAINMAFDREQIVKNINQGVGSPTQQVFSPAGDAFVEEAQKTYDFDVEGAKQLMAEAGYPDGFSVTMPSLVFTTPFEPTIKQALENIGIKVTWEPIPPQNTTSAVGGGKYPMVFWFDGLNIPARMLKTHYTPTAFLNPMRNEDPKLNALLEKLNKTVDPADQKPIYQDITRFVTENAWDAPVFYSGALVATAPGYEYKGTVANQFSSIQLFGVSK